MKKIKGEKGNNKAPPLILCDTREQRPLVLPNTQRSTLRIGDYSLLGLEDIVSVERKSIQDLFMCVGAERDRFERCLEKLARLPYPAIVVDDANFPDLLSAPPYSGVHPHSAIGSLISWSVRYRIPVWMAGDRRMAAGIVHKILTKALKYSAS